MAKMMATAEGRDLVVKLRARSPQTAMAAIGHLEASPPTGYRVQEAAYRRRDGRSGRTVDVRVVIRHQRKRARVLTPAEAVRELHEDYLLANPRGG